jgi:hypothetical protein
MIQTLEIELLEGVYFDQPWSCTLEIPVDHSLEELHLAIQNAVDFENDHLYEFVVGNSPRSHSSINFDCQSDEIYETSVEKLLEGSKGKKVFYYFDFGDSWLFQLKKSRKKPVKENPDTFYPRVVSENGKRPIQYPDWDEM